MARVAHLSIDWDFFVRCTIPWPNVHESMLYRVHKWKEREVQSQLMPPPSSWWHEFAAQYQFRNTEVHVADSHQFGAECIGLTGEGLDTIVHVDAHHDLGYDDYKELDCGNWLRFVLERKPHVNLRVIYPDWKGLADLNRRDRLWSSDNLLTRRVVIGCWSTDSMFVQNDVVITKVFICRSSAWTHPRHDKAFVKFVNLVAEYTNAKVTTPWTDLDGINPMVPRV